MARNECSARLALEDGSIWHGEAFGAEGTQVGEVVFNTSMTGYQEIITDPSYAGQIVVMTGVQVGNTGMNEDDDECLQPFMHGFIVRELSGRVSNWRASTDLSAWLRERNIIGISDIDTRALTRRLRERGSLKGVLSTDASLDDQALIDKARDWEGLVGKDLVEVVTCKEAYTWVEASETSWEPNGFVETSDEEIAKDELSVVVMDFGVKRNILRRLVSLGCSVRVVPASTSAEDILSLAPDGVMLSNGPGDPAAVPYAVETVKALIGKVPLYGICLGHQLLGQAMGGKTYKLKFGHHGGNQPVKHLPTGRVEISAHNHNFAVDADSLPDDVELTHLNLNDQCCEGIRHKVHPVVSIQYPPEAAPGPHDAEPFFHEFIELMRDHKQTKGK